MDYKQKYLKYKLKYLNLKKNKFTGGMSGSDDDDDDPIEKSTGEDRKRTVSEQDEAEAAEAAEALEAEAAEAAEALEAADDFFLKFKTELASAKIELIGSRKQTIPPSIIQAKKNIIDKLLESGNIQLSAGASYLILKGSNGVRLCIDKGDVDLDYDFDFKLISTVDLYKRTGESDMQEILKSYRDELYDYINLHIEELYKHLKDHFKDDLPSLQNIMQKLAQTPYTTLLYGYIASKIDNSFTTLYGESDGVKIMDGLQKYYFDYITAIIKGDTISIIPYKITAEYDDPRRSDASSRRVKPYALCDIIFQLDQIDDISIYGRKESIILEKFIYYENSTRSLLEYIYLYYNVYIRDEKKSTWISMIELLLREIDFNKLKIDELYLDNLNTHLLRLFREAIGKIRVSEIEKIKNSLEKYISLCRLISTISELPEKLINDYVQIKKIVEQEVRLLIQPEEELLLVSEEAELFKATEAARLKAAEVERAKENARIETEETERAREEAKRAREEAERVREEEKRTREEERQVRKQKIRDKKEEEKIALEEAIELSKSETSELEERKEKDRQIITNATRQALNEELGSPQIMVHHITEKPLHYDKLRILKGILDNQEIELNKIKKKIYDKEKEKDELIMTINQIKKLWKGENYSQEKKDEIKKEKIDRKDKLEEEINKLKEEHEKQLKIGQKYFENYNTLQKEQAASRFSDIGNALRSK